MPVFLKHDERRDVLTVSIGRMEKSEFQDTLARVKSTPGRSWNAEDKVWEFPNNPTIAMRLMTAVQPVVDAAVETMLRDYANEVAGQLITSIGDDAEGLRYERADDLFAYQRALVDYAVDHPKLIVADEMGLGKTIEAIAILHEYYARQENGVNRPVLVICPKAVRGTWAQEFQAWSHHTPMIVNGRDPDARLEQLQADGHDVWIINWESFWREPIIDFLVKQDWAAIIADEAHRAKNRTAKQAKGLHRLRAPVQLAMTGTPIMNTPDELWSLLHWMDRKTYSSFWAFHNMYVDEIQSGGFNRRVMVGVKNPDELRFELKDKLVRRTKKVLGDKLPEKMPTQVIEVELSKAQRKLYDEVQDALFLDIQAHIDAQVAEGADREELIEEFASMPLDKLVALVPNAAARIAKQRQITAAAKVEVARDLIREEPDTPVVAFTWHVDPARKLAALLSDGPQGQRVGTIAGTDDADPVKDAFQKGELDHVVCTIAKGGTGLTLTRSSNPILVEEDWVPSINDQAIDRTHRVGQHDVVTPRVLRCKDTVDDGRVAPRNTFKRAVTAQIIGG